MDDLVEWFEEADGFSFGTKAPHKWVLQAAQELRIQAAALTEAQAEIERLRRHLVATTDWMERTRASGDSGFWDWGADDVYTRARAALSTKGAADAQDGKVRL